MLGTKTVRRVAQDYISRTLQDSTANLLESVASVPLLDGRLVLGVKVTANQAVLVNHGLGRAYQGYFVTRAQGAHVLFYEQDAARLDKTKQLRLIPSATATIDLWVF